MKNDSKNREQMIETLLNGVFSLDAEKQNELYEKCLAIHNKSLTERLGHQTAIYDVAFSEIYRYAKAQRAAGLDDSLLFMDIFTYGVIHGIRKERARRQRKPKPHGIMYP